MWGGGREGVEGEGGKSMKMFVGLECDDFKARPK